MSSEEITRANESFYAAFEALDVETMGDVWLKSDSVRCVHPGWRTVSGWEPVMTSWQAIFENTSSMQFILTEVEISEEGDVGIVTCIENIMAGVGESERMGAVQATNIFVKQESAWKMILHHSSPIAHLVKEE
ncbi:MAG: nuclear transport factor 2 family protein [Planctomycetota bacterium]|jgi:ketosteroid isomerase-like protein|nr:nuclear transport factor 2 family protein [Planctomycetota bacterium]MDP7254209.1 nuclear transport factor 2 family protein [Planctomycetota bacterium]